MYSVCAGLRQAAGRATDLKLQRGRSGQPSQLAWLTEDAAQPSSDRHFPASAEGWISYKLNGLNNKFGLVQRPATNGIYQHAAEFSPLLQSVRQERMYRHRFFRIADYSRLESPHCAQGWFFDIAALFLRLVGDRRSPRIDLTPYSGWIIPKRNIRRPRMAIGAKHSPSFV
jgi:hypothetical protein